MCFTCWIYIYAKYSLNGSPIKSPNRSSPAGVLQFGKTRRKRYALDFRHPVSTLQAFGICLSLFNWTV